ncbi:hypothetical protein [Microtetraspora malaysiensis]|uniref:hypothetical protein n=1 Tax=Microtetraspora malaysiensis TaxID=161358 RepID=UPI003D94AB05
MAAQKSADEAATMSQIEQERRKDEREHLHRDLHPTDQTVVESFLKGSARQNLFGSLTVKREVRGHAETVLGPNARGPVTGLPLLLLPNRAYEFHIEDWRDGQTKPQVDEIVFKF